MDFGGRFVSHRLYQIAGFLEQPAQNVCPTHVSVDDQRFTARLPGRFPAGLRNRHQALADFRGSSEQHKVVCAHAKGLIEAFIVGPFGHQLNAIRLGLVNYVDNVVPRIDGVLLLVASLG